MRRVLVVFLALFLCSNFCLANESYNNYTKNSLLQNEFADYMTELREQIQRNWNPPESAEDGEATITFRVNRYGEISNIVVTESSNSLIFDESALEALRKSAPFKKFPASTSRNALNIKYTFNTSFVKTDILKEYIQKADKYFNLDNSEALKYINLAINEVQGDINSYFLFAKRSKIKKAMGDYKGADEDLVECKRLKSKFDQKRINSCKIYAEMEKSPYAYFSLAHSYEVAGDYAHAIEAIDKAINMTELNNNYKRYRAELIQKSSI